MIGDVMTASVGIILVSVLVSFILVFGTEMVLKHIGEEE
tara:strand:- start:1028 stop:1144 length:117 start_codon:yes stop_codon:yes gene_type:complete